MILTALLTNTVFVVPLDCLSCCAPGVIIGNIVKNIHHVRRVYYTILDKKGKLIHGDV